MGKVTDTKITACPNVSLDHFLTHSYNFKKLKLADGLLEHFLWWLVAVCIVFTLRASQQTKPRTEEEEARASIKQLLLVKTIDVCLTQLSQTSSIQPKY